MTSSSQGMQEPATAERYQNTAKLLMYGSLNPGQRPGTQPAARCPPTSTYCRSVRIPELPPSERGRIWWFDALRAVQKEGKREGVVRNIIVHGSYGDVTQCNFSDVDLTVVINESCLCDGELLRTLQRWLWKRLHRVVQSVDPLQHHGPFFLWERLIRDYSEAVLPVAAYESAWAVEPAALRFTCHADNKARPIPASVAMCESLVGRIPLGLRLGNMFSLKQYLSRLLLVPALYAADNGHPLHKAASFPPFYLRFPEASQPVKAASEIRATWPATPGWFRVLASAVRPRPGSAHWVHRVYNSFRVRSKVLQDVVPGLRQLLTKLQLALRTEGPLSCRS